MRGELSWFSMMYFSPGLPAGDPESSQVVVSSAKGQVMVTVVPEISTGYNWGSEEGKQHCQQLLSTICAHQWAAVGRSPSSCTGHEACSGTAWVPLGLGPSSRRISDPLEVICGPWDAKPKGALGSYPHTVF